MYLRINNVKRTFGNKTTWDKPFKYYLLKFVNEINNAIFDNGKKCRAIQKDALEIKNEFDLVYIDTPYISNKGVGVDYFQFYHFLEGICDYFNWEKLIDYSKKHRPLKAHNNRWTDKAKITSSFYELIDHFRKSHIVISYRSDGIPSIEELISIVKQFKRNVRLMTSKNYKYVLSTNNNSNEILLIGWD